MTDRLIRLLRLITLIQSKPGILARELAERCETTERTIYRDLEALSAAAAARSRWEFLLTASPLAVPLGTGSALNPIATF